jgi:hypothetical protein
MNILPALKDLLQNEGITTTIKLNRAPDKPNAVVVLRDTGGLDTDPNDTTQSARQNKTFQVYVRAESDSDAIDICADIRAALVGQIGLIYGALKFQNILVQTEFQSIGGDDTGRPEYTGNFRTFVVDYTREGAMPGGGTVDGGTPTSTYGGNTLDGGTP